MDESLHARRVELHHYRARKGRLLTQAMLTTDPPASGKEWTTRVGCGHKHRSDASAIRCASRTWPGIAVDTEGAQR